MIPSKTWFPGTLQERAAWYQNFNKQIQVIGLTLGLTQDELDQIKSDNDVIQFLANTATEQKAYDDAVRTYRKIITEGAIGDITPPFPANPAHALPVVIPTGMFERLSDIYRTRILASVDYTDEQGNLLGIIGTTPAPPDPASVKPTIEVFAAQTGYLFSVVIANRGESDTWETFILPKGSANWSLAKTATGKSADIVIVPAASGEPQMLQVRVQLRKNNANYGQLSDTVYVTVNP